MIQILTIIAPLFLIIFGSAFLRKVHHVGDEWEKVLNDFALKIGLPVLIFSALARTSFSFRAEAALIIANSLFVILGFLLAVMVGKTLHLRKPMFFTLLICFVFDNVVYLGIPVLKQVSGEAIVPTVSLLIAVYLFWIFTIGMSCLEYSLNKDGKDVAKNLLKNFFRNPLLLSVVLGLFVGNLKISLPSLLLQSLDMISASV